MIKSETTITGTVKRASSVRKDKNDKTYVAFVVGINIPNGQSGTLEIEVFVTIPEPEKFEWGLYTEGKRVTVSGSMDIRKREEHLNFYLTATAITTDNVAEKDSIAGTLTFRGHLKTEKVYEEKKDKNGHPFVVFSAYSAEKVGDGFVSTWVDFVRFAAKDADRITIPDFMRPKARVEIKGDLSVSAYNGKIKLSSRVQEMSEYVYVPNN